MNETTSSATPAQNQPASEWVRKFIDDQRSTGYVTRILSTGYDDALIGATKVGDEWAAVYNREALSELVAEDITLPAGGEDTINERLSRADAYVAYVTSMNRVIAVIM